MWVLSCVWLFLTPWTIARQAPLSMEFPRQEYWRGLPFPPGVSSWPRNQNRISCVSGHCQAGSLPLHHLYPGTIDIVDKILCRCGCFTHGRLFSIIPNLYTLEPAASFPIPHPHLQVGLSQLPPDTTKCLVGGGGGKKNYPQLRTTASFWRYVNMCHASRWNIARATPCKAPGKNSS